MTVLGEPFDRALPSPLMSLAALKSSGEDSVVATGRISGRQRAMYVATDVDEVLRSRVQSDPDLRLIVLSGSAGCGKSALIRRLQEMVPLGTFTATIEDATHADSPSEDQTNRIVDALTGFREGVPGPGYRLLMAANTGLLLELQLKLRRRGEDGLADLIAFLLIKLGVPAAPRISAQRKAELGKPVLVVDLDQRPTSGGTGRLLRQMLDVLHPDKPGSVLGDTRRCGTCEVRSWCAPRTNAELLADPRIAATLDAAVEQIAYIRGRDVAPRQLWDGVAELAFGGISSSGDPCDEIARIAVDGDHTAIWQAILPNGALQAPAGALTSELALQDPSYRAAERVHEIVATAGVVPKSDADQLRILLSGGTGERAAIHTAAEALAHVSPAAAARGLVRANWLVGALPPVALVPTYFTAALTSDAADDAIEHIIRIVSDGLVQTFGVMAEGSSYLPTESLAETRDARVLVQLDLLDNLDLRPPRALLANPAGSSAVGLRPLAGRLTVGKTSIDFDLQLFWLLQRAQDGAMPATLDIERFHALRYAVERLGRSAAEHDGQPLLITDAARGTFRLNLISRRGREQFRITKVA